MERQNTYELVFTSVTTDFKDSLITLYINGLFICSLHSFDMVKLHLSKHMKGLNL